MGAPLPFARALTAKVAGGYPDASRGLDYAVRRSRISSAVLVRANDDAALGPLSGPGPCPLSRPGVRFVMRRNPDTRTARGALQPHRCH